MRIKELLKETPLPNDWDTNAFKTPGSSFKSRLAYALERAKRVGQGSSRVAFTIEYEGRPTILKVAKNRKGLAQNAAEVNILDDGYARHMDILIPLIDYDQENIQPLWIQTESAQKVTSKQLNAIFGIENLYQLMILADSILKPNTRANAIIENIKQNFPREVLDNTIDYANDLATLKDSFNVNLGDFTSPNNWGLYQGKPVIIDIGLTHDVTEKYYKRKR